MLEWLGNKFDVFWTNIKFVTVYEYQEGIIYRNGKFRKHIQKGLHPRIPFLESFTVINIRPETFQIAAVTVTTMDGKTASVGAILERQVTDTPTYVQNFNGADGNMQDLVRSVIANTVSRCTWEEIKSKNTHDAVFAEIGKVCKRMGMEALHFSFTEMTLTRSYTFTPTSPKV
ncbi:MAG: domain / Band 7 family [Bacteroidetes bacterium]|jgi:regulator of protease activity HflC (stomatin/prohibitin superfamily)|nr:domain / Band 7 family [Bacteroidota bacterium]